MPYSFIIRWMFPLTLIIALSACDQSDQLDTLQGVRDLVLRDNGNRGDGSDIEVLFSKQTDLSNVLFYQIYLIKADRVEDDNLSTLLDLDKVYYVTAMPDDIYPLQGKKLYSKFRDTDGDYIIEDEVYHAAVISMPFDLNEWSPQLTVSRRPLSIGTNNIVKEFSRELESGYGDFTINANGDLFMSAYDIEKDLDGKMTQLSPIFSFSSSGGGANYTEYRGILGGIACNSRGILFQSVIDKGEVISIDPTQKVGKVFIKDDRIKEPDGLFINKNDEIFIVDRSTGYLFKSSPEGKVSLYARVGKNARGVTGDANGNLYVTINEDKGTVIKVDPEQRVSHFSKVPTSKPVDYISDYIMWLGYPRFHNNEIYVPSPGTNKIFKVLPNGEVSEFAGSGKRLFPRGDLKSAHFNRPMSLIFDQDGKTLYVNGSLETTPWRVQAFTPAKVYKVDLVE